MRISAPAQHRRVTMAEAKHNVVKVLAAHGLSPWETVAVLNDLISQQVGRGMNMTSSGGCPDTPPST